MDPMFLRADEAGVRLEIVGNLPIWEPSPSYRHQKAIDRIRSSSKPPGTASSDSVCLNVSGVYVQFPDGSLKRLDISFFDCEPEEMEDAITLVPTAVVEVISWGYEKKDLE